MRIDNPTIEGVLTLPADAGASGSFSGSFEGNFSGTGTIDSASVATRATELSADATASIADKATTSSIADELKGGTNISGSSMDLTGDLTVAGTASFGLLQSTTASAVIIGDSRLILNADTPTVRFAGLTVYDSGSDPLTTASFLYDGDSHDWKYEYESGGDHDAAVALFGPVMSDLTGSYYIASESVVVGNGSHHLSSSLMHISDGEVRIHGAVSASSTGEFSSLGINTAPSGVAGAILATNDVVAFASSDERLKTNLEPIGSAVEKVEQLTGYTFNWIPMEDVHVYGDMKDIGVVAQEVEKVLPEIVSDRENGYKAVKYDKLTAVLIQAVKELSERVKVLESK